MYVCLCAIREEKFFPLVVYGGGTITEAKKTELAEEAFHDAWADFNNQGRAGRNNIKEATYTWYFFGVFRQKFLRLFKQELKKAEIEAVFGKQLHNDDPVAAEIHKYGMDLPEIQAALQRVGSNCQELLTWKFKDKLNHDVIAQRKNILRQESIQMVSRCKVRFLEIWRGSRNDFN
jgi:hypothetical protein